MNTEIFDNSELVNSKVWERLKAELEEKLKYCRTKLENEKDLFEIAKLQGQIQLVKTILSYENSEEFNART